MGYPSRPATEERLMMEPPPASFSRGTANRAQRNWPVMLTSRVRLHSSGLTSSTGAVGPAMPALLISTSSPPRCAARSAKSRSTSAGTATSARVNPTPGSSWSRSAPRSPSTSQTCTPAPCPRKAAAILRPIPEAPAVTSTRVPSRIFMVRSLVACYPPARGLRQGAPIPGGTAAATPENGGLAPTPLLAPPPGCSGRSLPRS